MRTTQIKLKQYLFLLITLLGYGISHGQETPPPRFKTYQSGTNFTSIAVDQNKSVWGGTDRTGLFKLDQNDTIASTFQLTALGTAPAINTLRIQSLAADKSGNIWVGHGGTNTSNTQGGVERIEVATNAVQHLSPDRDARGFTFLLRDGIGTLNAQQVVVDPNNKVWIAHRYHDLTVTGTPSSYILTPGTFSSRVADDYTGKFNAVSTWEDYLNGQQDVGLPYPDYTYNPTPSQSAQSRTCNAISADRGNVWVSVMAYKQYNVENYFPSRLLQYSNTGQLLSTHTMQNARFNLGGVFHAVYANNNKGVWAATSIAGNGFSVFKNGIWYNITDPSIIPPGTRFNRAAIWGDSFGRVYMGTNKGLIVYDGSGYVDSPYSYTLYTKDPYTSPLGRSVHDPDMVSNDIVAGTIESPLKQYYSWIATTSGIMRAYLPYGDAIAFHVKDKDQPNKETLNGKDNYEIFASLKKTSLSYVPLQEDIPSFAVDGTTSSVIRLKTNDPGGYYAPNSLYRIELRKYTSDALPGDRNSTEYIEQYGQFTLKPVSDYGNNVQLQDLKYVDFVYKHPIYIKPEDFVTNKHYTEYDIFVFKKTPQQTDELIFRHPIKLCLPPVLFGHGVWSDINSIADFETYFKSKGYSDYETSKAWRTNPKAPENHFYTDAHIIPTYIDNLLNKALGNKVSAGKVNVVVHSRGGLYTRAYIEEIKAGIPFKNNINALVTLDTPHAGSQAANGTLDKRILNSGVLKPIIESSTVLSGISDLADIAFNDGQPIRIGDIFALASKHDKENKYGAKNLIVEKDLTNSEGLDASTWFIPQLNGAAGLAKFQNSKVPIHAVAGNFNICLMHPGLCNANIDVIKIPPIFGKYYLLMEATRYFAEDVAAPGIQNFLNYVYNGPSDAIVPDASMKAGLSSQYVSAFSNLNVCHVDTGNIGNSVGVTQSPEIQASIFEKFKEKFNNPSSTFSTQGVNPPKLEYKFLQGIALSTTRLDPVNSKIVINPNSFTPALTSGADVTFNVYQENVDRILILISYKNDAESDYMIRKSTGLQFNNTFAFTVPADLYGQATVTAYGFKDGRLTCEHTVEANVSLPTGITLQSMKFAENKVTIPERGDHNYRLLGTFSDGVERMINDYAGIVYTLENNHVTRPDFEIVKGETPGQCFLKATIATLTAQTEYTVEEDPTLRETLVTDFYATYNTTGPVTLNWATHHEYRSKKFILESSLDNVTFSPINEQPGQGTTYNPTNYHYDDPTSENVIYYRLRLLNLDDTEVFNKVIEVNRAPLSTNDPDLLLNTLRLTPNPLTVATGTIAVPAKWNGTQVTLNIYDSNGRQVASQDVNYVAGTTGIPFDMPQGAGNGLYLVQLKTNTFVKTLKLIYQR
ncbi:T9SS type A sorting domain-containing protein [Flavobacterium humi]|uniref:T9SS type A sorting domain-containing protein n=1 Tax=Flavobacterium humi TaxID=2562683 RepID=A0A4Z0LAB5_9FLAO|nr:T9SS type A sorting domain-containing protein [Flavobacterium humi]TGD59080.1 T9SS type A sorting domain-containing protein [Flavobacterium humi]